MREQAIEKHKEEINEADTNKANEKGDDQTPEVSKDRLEKLEAANILSTENIFQSILAADEPTQKIQMFPKFNDIVSKCDEDIKDKTTAYQDQIVTLHSKKVGTISYCKKVLKEAETIAEKKAIELTDDFKALYLELRKKMDDHPGEVNWDDAEKSMLALNSKLVNDLLSLEVRQVENLTSAMVKFNGQIDLLNGQMDSDTSEYFNDIGNFVVQYQSDMLDHVKRYLEEIQKQYEDEELDMDDPATIEIMAFVEEPEYLTSIFDQLKENLEGKFGDKEARITKD